MVTKISVSVPGLGCSGDCLHRERRSANEHDVADHHAHLSEDECSGSPQTCKEGRGGRCGADEADGLQWTLAHSESRM